MIETAEKTYSLTRTVSHWLVQFTAMASPCEVLIACEKATDAERLALLAYSETSRIERKFSRYRDDSAVAQINRGNGQPVAIDDETFQLLTYAGECYALTDGLFDITSGILRRAWTFDGREVRSDQGSIDRLLELVGWEKVELTTSAITLLPGMQIDLGGVGKEYAVDRVASLLYTALPVPLLVNFGGDLRAICPPMINHRWDIGVEATDQPNRPVGLIELSHGGVATSGVSYRHCFVNGKRLGHILNPLTGWPVENAPKSVTVLADTCTEAGLLTTTAMLHGDAAEDFLKAQGVVFHCSR